MPPLHLQHHALASTGDTLYDAGEHGPVLQLQSGAVRLDGRTADGLVFVQLALPGDYLGLERDAGLPYAFTARAIVPCVVRHGTPASPLQADPAESWQQQHRRCRETLQLRTGPAPERLRQLLLLLSGGVADDLRQDMPLPMLKDMAAIIDSAPETVSRILGSLRRSEVLSDRQPQQARFSRQVLRDSPLLPGMSRSIRQSPAAMPR